MTPEEEDRAAERHMLRLFVGVIEAVNWTDTRAQVSILRALLRAALLLIASHPDQEVRPTRAQCDAGEQHVFAALVAWHNTLLAPTEGGEA
ncbi:MAG: hypothetical protein K2V38_05475 [Gemmataceae bacterium]|nr:hypothetical protein [Gemmataceae bacterium]